MSIGLARIGIDVGVGRAKSMYRRYGTRIKIALLLTLSVIVLVWPVIFVTVPAGHVAVIWHRLSGGTDTENVYGEGGHFKLPWDVMPIYDARVQQVSHDFDVLTSDGLTMTINIAFRFHVNEAMVGKLHKHVGPEYIDKLLVPTVGSFARIILSQNSMENIYTARRAEIQSEVTKAVIADMVHDFGQGMGQRAPWVFVDDVLIRSMQFPPTVQAAVNRKIEQYQLEQEYGYRLRREELESRRKAVEARGIAEFQKIVSSGISDTYLRWKGIDATLALAQSPNAKVVVIGSGSQNMPLILGGEELARTGQAPPVPADQPAKLRPESTPTPTAPSSGAATEPSSLGSTPEGDKLRSSGMLNDGSAASGLVETFRRVARSRIPQSLLPQTAPISPMGGKP